MWCRVFCRDEAGVAPADLLLATRGVRPDAEAAFKGDDLGWTAASITVGVGTPLFLERYLTKVDDLRDDLNTWAAWLETQAHSPSHAMLMERVVQSRQLVTIRKPVDHADESAMDDVCRAICGFLARTCDGVYQIDGVGWFAADGQLLLTEY